MDSEAGRSARASVARHGVRSQPVPVALVGECSIPVEGCPPALLVVSGEPEIVALPRHADRDVPDASPPFRFGSRSLLLIAAKGDSMSVLVASEIPRTRR